MPRPLTKNPLDVVKWHEKHGENVSKTAEHFKLSRTSIYAYLNPLKYRKFPVNPLRRLHAQTQNPQRRIARKSQTAKTKKTS
jgi:hypothetical protein